MKKRISENYFYRIFLTVFGVSLLLVLLLAFLSESVFRNILKSNLRESSTSMAVRVRDSLEETAASYKNALTSLSVNPQFQDFFTDGESWDATEIMRSLYLAKNSFSRSATVSVVRLSDQRWISTGNQTMESRNASFSNWGVFRMANESEGAVCLTFARDAMLHEDDRLCVALACRSGSVPGQVLGYLLIEMRRDAIASLVSEHSDSFASTTIIINKNNSVIYHSESRDQEGISKGMHYLPDGSPLSDGLVLSGTYVVSVSDSLELYILEEMPLSVVSAAGRSIIPAFVFGILLTLVLALLASRQLSKSVVNPIQNIISSISRIKKGDLSVRLHMKRSDEIGQLADSFDSMTERVQTLMANVEEEKHSLWVAETKSLSLQMNPHFLYNTLDIIKWNAKLGNTDEIVKTTVQLGRLLRRIMNTRDDLVSVQYEMEIVEAFIGIMQNHFGDRLRLETDLDASLLQAFIPKLVIQPIVENAVVHGFKNSSGDCLIHITGRENGDYLVFSISDNGCGMTQEDLDHLLDFRLEGIHHIGLYNVQRRAVLLGDEHCGITAAASSEGHGTSVTLTLKKNNSVSSLITGSAVR